MKGHHKLADSSPCADCYNKMRQLNVKTIVYSRTNGEIVKQRLRDYKPKVISLGRQFINNGYNAIYRDRADERFISYDDNEYNNDDDDTRSVTSYSSGTSYSSLSTTSSTSSSVSSIKTTSTMKTTHTVSTKTTQTKTKTQTKKHILRKKKQNKFIKKMIKNKNKYN